MLIHRDGVRDIINLPSFLIQNCIFSFLPSCVHKYTEMFLKGK